jgi:exopolysaccharide biosynthesis predicted pyruvyltransferase EpsI
MNVMSPSDLREHMPETMIGRLQRQFDLAVSPLLGTGRVALLDFPSHPNVGDAAIWAGEIRYLRRIGREPAYVSTLANLEPARLRAALGDQGTILLHGGGNFGDIWAHHQRFREQVIATFPELRIVQLPQSIHYRDEARADDTARVIERHPDFTLLVRDQASLDFARERFACDSQLVPDAAFQIGPVQPGQAATDVLALLRTDDERADRPAQPPTGVRIEDWLAENRQAGRAIALAALAWGGLRDGGPDGARKARYAAVAEARVRRGLRQLGAGSAIITDRLHGHILATLLGRPQALLDNSYGKLGRFLDAFSGGTPLVYRAASLEDAVDWARAAAAATKIPR